MALVKISCQECGSDDLDDVVCSGCYEAACDEAVDAQAAYEDCEEDGALARALEEIGQALSDWHAAEAHAGPVRFCRVDLCAQVLAASPAVLA